MSHLDPNVANPISRPMRACYRDSNGVEHVPAYVTVIGGEWYDCKAVAARKAMGLDVTPDE